MTSLCEVLQLICDPQAALLPGYFVVNELLKLCPDYQRWPHWRVSRLLTDFVENFQKAAQLLSIVNRTRLRPVVEHSGHSGWSMSSWKLDSRTLKFGLNGSLPYSAELLAPQPALLNHVLRQPYSKEMVCAMIDMTKKKQRCSVLEEQLISLTVSSLRVCHATDVYNQTRAKEAMASTGETAAASDGTANAASAAATAAAVAADDGADDPTISAAAGGAGSSGGTGDGGVGAAGTTSSSAGGTNNPASNACNSGTVSTAPSSPDHFPCPCHHISSLLIHFVLHQLINFPALVLALHNKLQKLKMREGRDHLMWVLLQYLSGTIQKNSFSEFLPVLRLIGTLSCCVKYSPYFEYQ
ncbi:Mediator complex subunit Med23 [Trinorchestia longiramus]|nr:Mediator complex subunit Med23 [Trinorchestia longiramus]